MSVAVDISPDILLWIKKQLLPPEVIKTLDQWISGDKIPNVSTVRNFSQKTHIPFGYFFLKTPPIEELNIAHCRTINSLPLQNSSRELIDIFNSMVNIKDWMSDYCQQNDFSQLDFVGKFAENSNINSIASDIRTTLEISVNWFTHTKNPEHAFTFLRKKISDLGILVMQNGVVNLNNTRKLSILEFRAFTLIDKYAPLIFINSNDSAGGKLFSLLHELAHIWIGKENLFNDNFFNEHSTHIERTCNAVAAEILVPKEIFLTEWNSTGEENTSKIERLAKFFKCSELVIARRALDFSLIDKILYNYIVAKTEKIISQSIQPTPKKSSGGDFYSNLMSKWDHKIIEALDSSTKSGVTPYIDAYRLTNLKAATFHKLADSLGRAKF